MISVKELQEIDLTSYTIIFTAISVLFAVIFSIVITLLFGILAPGNIGIALYLIPTLVVGAFMIGIYRYFSEGLFFNLLAKKLKNIKIALNDGEIVKISPTETATILATIATIQAILLYLISVIILPLMINTAIQTFMLSGQQLIAMELYQIMMIISQPMTIIMFIFGTFIITFISILIGAYIYNILASKGRGVELELSEENGMTVIESIDMMKFAIAAAIIGGILNLIFGIIMLISGGNIVTLISNVITGFVGGFISAALIAIFYNFLAPKLGKLKIKLTI
ncbi:hypothetical protein [Methanobrevibacter sp.]|uniref:hypothetical protein n=1 Tax=Methanobrevibacter sp. TaxID=66852 RepID=UPI0025F217DB|nr:hypothetical protein [Methanobrevibacter sp.]MBQ6512181.1 hypothetical protein [Methanobrevibacter sp.]